MKVELEKNEWEIVLNWFNTLDLEALTKDEDQKVMNKMAAQIKSKTK